MIGYLLSRGVDAFAVVGMAVLLKMGLYCAMSFFEGKGQQEDTNKPASISDRLIQQRAVDVSNYFHRLLNANLNIQEAYYKQVREQANKSFRAAIVISIAGFGMLLYGCYANLSIDAETDRATTAGTRHSQQDGATVSTENQSSPSEDAQVIPSHNPGVAPAIVTTIGGVLLQFISGAFFWLYRTTIKQLADFHQSLVEVQNFALSMIVTARIQTRNLTYLMELSIALPSEQSRGACLVLRKVFDRKRQ